MLQNITNKIKDFISKSCYFRDFILVLPLGDTFLYLTLLLGNSEKIIGAIGEEIAATLLEKERLRILDRNWRCGRGEIDIIAYKNKCVVFCEVKTRKEFEPNFYPALTAINENKQQQIKKLGVIYVTKRLRYSQHIRAKSYRFDVITVTYKGGTLFGSARARHYPNAFS